MNKKYIVTLTAEERAELQEMIAHGKRAARTLAHARILLKADKCVEEPVWDDAAISQAVEVSTATVQRVRQFFVEDGLSAALTPRPRRRTARLPLVDGVAEAHLVTLACSVPPAGAGRWTLRLLAKTMVELAYVEHVSHETVRQVRKKNEVQPWLTEEWCLPPAASGEFVCTMEDVRDVYTLPYDPAYPQVCMDELSKQLVGETRVPVPPAPGQVARIDYEYVRLGVANLFIFFEPLAGWRHVTVTARRTKRDGAHAVRDLVDVYYPHAVKIRLVLDNLNTHVGGSLYEAFPPAEARRILDRLEIPYPPNMAVG